jgi:hypothetical protein
MILVGVAAVRKGITREGMRAIVRAGGIPGFCEQCGDRLKLAVLRREEPHPCRVSNADRVVVVVRRSDVDDYQIDRARQAAGHLGGLATQEKETP